MGSNILITGAGGYIGGSLVANLLASKKTSLKKDNIIAAVRSEEQATALSNLGINVVQLDLADENAVAESLLKHDIKIVVHTASSMDSRLALSLVNALSKQREISGEETYFIHTSALGGFYESTGWPDGDFHDTGPVFDMEKQVADSHPIRSTDVAVIEHAKAQGVTSFIVIPSTVYGKGSGEWNKLSVVLPPWVQASISRQRVYRFAEPSKVSGVHISDLTALYERIIENILQKEPIPSGAKGYYFALAHDIVFPEVLDHLAAALYARGLVTDSKTQVWPSDKFAAEALGIPPQFLAIFASSGGNITADNPYKIGWQPTWNKEQFLKNIDDEVQAVVEHGKAKSSLVASLFAAAAGM